jgi:hypothetical protein
MQGLSGVLRRGSSFITDNSPALLTGIGVAGVVTTVFLTAKASFRAAQILRDVETKKIEETGELLEPKEMLELTWKVYIPPATAAVMTVAAIIFASRIGARRAAAMTAAYALSEKLFDEYRDKIVEKMGEKKEEAARDELAQERVTANPPNDDIVSMVTGISVLCMDAYTGRYFISDMETIKAAVNEINYRILNGEMYISLTEFYESIGLDATSMSGDVGWNVDKLLDVKFSSTLTPKNHPCLVMDFRTMPVRYYEHFH